MICYVCGKPVENEPPVQFKAYTEKQLTIRRISATVTGHEKCIESVSDMFYEMLMRKLRANGIGSSDFEPKLMLNVPTDQLRPSGPVQSLAFDELVRRGVRRIKMLGSAAVRTPGYELPADSFLEECVRDILKPTASIE